MDAPHRVGTRGRASRTARFALLASVVVAAAVITINSVAQWNAVSQPCAQGECTQPQLTTAYFSVAPPNDLAARLSEMMAPVFVIAGAEDCLVGCASVTALARLFPSGESVAIEKCAHYLRVEQLTAFRNAIDAFLDQ